MGVTNRNEIVYKPPDVASSTESLNIPHSTSVSSIGSAIADQEQQAQTSTASRNRHSTLLSFSTTRIGFGRKKLRRYKAVKELEVLLEEEEPNDILDNGIPRTSHFTKILNDPESSKIWDEFNAKDEISQSEIIKTEISKRNHITTNDHNPTFKNISSYIRNHLEVLDNLDVLEAAEKEIILFFSSSPEDVYFGKDKTSYQRLLIHGVAQYYGLNSNSINWANQRVIRVANPTKKPIDINYSLVKEIEIIQKNH